MIRRDNNFIKIGGKWYLESGPWFDLLEKVFRENSPMTGQIVFVSHYDISYKVLAPESYPDKSDIKTIVWTRIYTRHKYFPKRDVLWAFEKGTVPSSINDPIYTGDYELDAWIHEHYMNIGDKK